MIFGWIWTNLGTGKNEKTSLENKNPLELKFSFLFVVIFILMTIITKIASQFAGNYGVYGLSFVSGFADVDPFIMSISQSSIYATSLQVAAFAIVISTASNNLLKGGYVFLLGSEAVKRQSAILLIAFACLGFMTLFLL